MANSHSAFPAVWMDYFNRTYHHLPNIFSVLTNNFFDITGKARILIDPSSLLKPPPVAICPHTAARLQVQYLLPSGEAIFVEIAKEICSSQPQH